MQGYCVWVVGIENFCISKMKLKGRIETKAFRKVKVISKYYWVGLYKGPMK